MARFLAVSRRILLSCRRCEAAWSSAIEIALARSVKYPAGCLQPLGDELIATDHGYNACNNVLAECARRAGARLVIARIPFPLSAPEQVVAAMLAAVTPRTRLLDGLEHADVRGP